jgi:thymidylate synthase
MNINKKYQELLHKIYYKGFEYGDPNRKGVIRKQIPYYNFEHDFEDGFPIIGLKQTYPKMAFNEMKAFMMGKTSLKGLEDLGVTFWRDDAYNYYKSLAEGMCKPVDFDTFLDFTMKGNIRDYFPNYTFGDLGKIYSHQIRDWNGAIDQLNEVLERLKKEPNSTKNIITMWNPSDLDDCCLTPCHRSFEFLVENLPNGGRGLRVKWEQSSCDVFLGLPINILYYSFVCYIFANYLGMKPLGIIGNLSNVHLYDNSFSAVEDLLKFNPDDLEPIKIETNFTKEWNNLDDYLRQLDFAENIKIKDYKHLGRFDVKMLSYSK